MKYMKLKVSTSGRSLPRDIMRTFIDDYRIALPLRSANAFIKKSGFLIEEMGITDIEQDGIDEAYSYYDSLSLLAEYEEDLF